MTASALDRKIQQLIVVVAILAAAFAIGLLAAQQAGLSTGRAGDAVMQLLADDADDTATQTEALAGQGFEW